MKVSNMTPRAEPVAWSVVIAAVVAAAASYGLNITDELTHLLILIGPFILAGIAARFSVFAPDTVKEKFPPPGNEIDPMDEDTWLSPPEPGR